MTSRFVSRRLPLRVEQLESRRMLMCDGFVDLSQLMERFTSRSPFADGAGDTVEEAFDLGTLEERETLSGRLGFYSDDADVFQFELATTSDVEIALRERIGDSDWRLLDADENELLNSDDDGNQATTNLTAGTYFVEVTRGGSRFSRYRLAVDPEVATDPMVPITPTNPITQPVLGQTPPEAPSSFDPQPDPTTVPGPLPDVAYFGGSNEWNLNTIGAPEAWAQGTSGESITVAVIDTGVDTRHADLNDNIWFNIDEIAGDGIDNDRNGFVDDVNGWNFVEDNANVYDTQGHGTHVAGTIAAEQNGFGATGVAFDADIMPIRVLGDQGYGSSFDIATGIRYAVDNGADIINLSLGGGYSSSIYSALQYANQNDVLVAIASGNDGARVPSYPALHSAALDNVISVGAFDRNQRSASFSNDAGNNAVQVDAPGVSVYSTLPGNRYGRYSGTSMAAPHVAGLAALALSANPNLSASALRNVLISGAQTDVIASVSPGVDASYSVAYAAANFVSANSVSAISDASTVDNGGHRLTSRPITLENVTPRIGSSPATNSVGQDRITAREELSTVATTRLSNYQLVDTHLAERKAANDDVESDDWVASVDLDSIDATFAYAELV